VATKQDVRDRGDHELRRHVPLEAQRLVRELFIGRHEETSVPLVNEICTHGVEHPMCLSCGVESTQKHAQFVVLYDRYCTQVFRVIIQVAFMSTTCHFILDGKLMQIDRDRCAGATVVGCEDTLAYITYEWFIRDVLGTVFSTFIAVVCRVPTHASSTTSHQSPSDQTSSLFWCLCHL